MSDEQVPGLPAYAFADLEQYRGHDMSSGDCVCNPRFAIRCDECNSDGCWACDQGWKEVPRVVAEEAGMHVILHNFDR